MLSNILWNKTTQLNDTTERAFSLVRPRRMAADRGGHIALNGWFMRYYFASDENPG